jgi:hypothetical protein
MSTQSYTRKMKKAVQMLFFRRHRQPGVKGWELKKSLGGDYMKVIQILNNRLRDMGMQVKTVYEDQAVEGKPTREQLEKARFFVAFNDPSAVDTLSGWRVDDIAVLTAAVAYINSKQGKVPRKEVEKLLKEKFPKWQIERTLDRYMRRGYLDEDEDKMLFLGWRSRAEIDQKLLSTLLLKQPTE